MQNVLSDSSLLVSLFAGVFTPVRAWCMQCQWRCTLFLSWDNEPKVDRSCQITEKESEGARRVVTLPVLNLNALGVQIHQEFEMWVVGLWSFICVRVCLKFGSPRLSGSCKIVAGITDSQIPFELFFFSLLLFFGATWFLHFAPSYVWVVQCEYSTYLQEPSEEHWTRTTHAVTNWTEMDWTCCCHFS